MDSPGIGLERGAAGGVPEALERPGTPGGNTAGGTPAGAGEGYVGGGTVEYVAGPVSCAGARRESGDEPL